MSEEYYLGFDLSTQQLKCLAIDSKLNIHHTETVEFEKDLPQYETTKGVYINGDTIDSPVAMWLDALDLVLQKYKNSGFDLSKVKALSGSCQQHGSVYWSKMAGVKLTEMAASKGSLSEQLTPDLFARRTAPNWQDHSTSTQCEQFERAVDGAESLAEISGSRAHFRFTGPQILKIAETEEENYTKTGTISLVSNFLASILCGKLTPIEEADACGMNMYDIKKRKYNQKLLNIIDKKTLDGEKLIDKLGGQPLKCDTPIKLGAIASYFVEKYGFKGDCSIFPFTGDNLATICSLPLNTNDVLISLGTSTTVLIVTDQYHPSPNYHLFIHPTIPKLYMGMICYCNGSLAREKTRDEINAKYGKESSNNWDLFNEAVSDKNLNTDNEIGVYFPLGEIVPSVQATYKRGLYNERGEIIKFVDHFEDARHDAKNIVESQALSCRVRISPLLNSVVEDNLAQKNEDTDVKFDYDTVKLREYLKKRPRKAFFVGGASKNDAIVRKFAEVIGSTEGNYRVDTPNSCALGGCYRAIWSELYVNGTTDLSFDKYLTKEFPWDDLEFICNSSESSWSKYNKKIIPLSNLEATLK